MTVQYVKRVNKEIYDINGKPFLLKGVGIGGWLLQEGYMLKSFGEIDRPRRFRTHILKMTNEEYLNYFYDKWHSEFFTEKDIILIKQQGFNSIRIALDYQFLFFSSDSQAKLTPCNKHFQMLDQVIKLCHKHKVYVILDMHAAPGGQTGTNIDNSKNNSPDLFTSELYQNQLCYIWKVIADRYHNEQYIAAYDLLNEPLPNWQSKYNNLLIPLYRRVIASIREVDNNHMITVEGLHWSTDWSCFTDVLDENILLQFHKYWSNPDIESIDDYTSTRDQLNVPIFMGEGGENNLEWYYSVFKLYTQKNISFNFWTYKKMSTHNSVSSFKKPDKWDVFLEGKTTERESVQVLNELLEYIQFDNCTINCDVVNHLLQKNSLIIPSYGYDYFGKGLSYYSNEMHKSSFRKSDGIAIVNGKEKVIEPDFKQYGGDDYTPENRLYIKLLKDEWVTYSFMLDKNTKLIQINVNPLSDKVRLKINDQNITNWTEYSLGNNSRNTFKLKIIAKEDVMIKNIVIKTERL